MCACVCGRACAHLFFPGGGVAAGDCPVVGLGHVERLVQRDERERAALLEAEGLVIVSLEIKIKRIELFFRTQARALKAESVVRECTPPEALTHRLLVEREHEAHVDARAAPHAGHGAWRAEQLPVVAEDAAEETTFWLVDEWMYELGLALHNTKAPPLVVSISWGYAETRQCGPTDFGPDMPANCTLLGIHSNASYVERVNVEFMKLALRGITLVASSGDRGAPGSINADCSHDRDPGKALNPGFPAASPYVLSVGATSLSPSTVMDPKAASTPKPCKPSLFFKGFGHLGT